MRAKSNEFPPSIIGWVTVVALIMAHGLYLFLLKSLVVLLGVALVRAAWKEVQKWKKSRKRKARVMVYVHATLTVVCTGVTVWMFTVLFF